MKKILTCCFLLSFTLLHSQNRVIDSLTNLLKTSKSDTNKVILLNQLAWECTVVASQKSLEYSKEASELAESLNYERGFLKAQGGKASTLRAMGKFKESEILFLDLINRHKEAGNTLSLGRAYINISLVYDQQGDYEKSIKYLTEASKIFEHHNDPKLNLNMIIHSNLGGTYSRMREYEKAILHFNKAASFITEDQNNGYDGTIYNGLAAAHVALHKYKEAWKYFERTEKVYIKLGYDNGLANLYLNISVYFIHLNENKKARHYGMEAIKKYGSNYMPFEIVGCLSSISMSYSNEWLITKEKKKLVYLDSARY